MKLLLGGVLLLAVFAVLTLWRAAQQQAAAEAAHPPAGQFVEVNGTPVHYVEAGSGPPVVLIHGSSGNLNDWTFDMVARLAETHRVIAFDRPGLGYTPTTGRNATLAGQARLLADAAVALGAERPVVVGHSFGGAVALSWALERPENLSGLVVLAGVSHPWETGIGAYYTMLSNPVAGPVMASLLAAWVPEPVVDRSVESVFAPQAAPQGYAAHFGTGLTLRRFSLLENARQRAALLPQVAEMVPRYPEIGAPTEILHGDADRTVSLRIHSEPLARALPEANLVVMPGVGHMPQHADPGAVADAVARVTRRAGLP